MCLLVNMRHDPLMPRDRQGICSSRARRSCMLRDDLYSLTACR